MATDPLPEGSVRCPHCGQSFALSEALTGPLRDHLRDELEREAQTRLNEAIARVRKDTLREAEDKLGTELKDKTEALAASRKALEDAQAQELSLRKQARELADKQAALELEVTRTLDAEREKLLAESRKRYDEEHHLKDREKDKLIGDLRKSLDEARRRAEQGSMETQGEVLELDLEHSLTAAFPRDSLLPVPKGIRGADILQQVCDETGRECGILLWETKNTKRWSAAWITKLKDDQVAARATLSILVSSVLPEGVDRFGFVDGVWVCDPASAIGLATALRHQLMSLAFEKLASVGKNEKMETLYTYLTGPEFQQKISTIVETFTGMQQQLDRERRAMERLWKEREKQIQRVVLNTSGLYGDIRGIAGASLPEMESLSLDEGPSPLSLSDGEESAG